MRRWATDEHPLALTGEAWQTILSALRIVADERTGGQDEADLAARLEAQLPQPCAHCCGNGIVSQLFPRLQLQRCDACGGTGYAERPGVASGTP